MFFPPKTTLYYHKHSFFLGIRILLHVVIQGCLYAENPDLEIDSLNIASHIKSEVQIQYILQDLSYGEFTMMDERRLVNQSPSGHEFPARAPMAFS